MLAITFISSFFIITRSAAIPFKSKELKDYNSGYYLRTLVTRDPGIIGILGDEEPDNNLLSITMISTYTSDATRTSRNSQGNSNVVPSKTAQPLALMTSFTPGLGTTTRYSLSILETSATAKDIYLPTSPDSTASIMSPTASSIQEPGETKASQGETSEWKAIGISVMAITVVASIILVAIFFDSWWGFLRDFLFGKRYNGGEESLVPDWNKRSWEYKTTNEIDHEHPTIAPSELDINETCQKGGTNLHRSNSLTWPIQTPRPTYSPDCNPHPLEPLARRPSLRHGF